MPWDPLHDIMTLQNRFGHLHAQEPGWTPAADVYETQDRYVVTAELAGLSRDDIHIELREGQLTISGRRADAGVAPDAYHRMERPQGHFSRGFVFAEPIAEGEISAEFREGVLTITLPKTARPQPRRITVE